MCYEDFVYFILSEEDKTNNVSLDYWFKCIDLDCDGCLRANEMLVSPVPLEMRPSAWCCTTFHFVLINACIWVTVVTVVTVEASRLLHAQYFYEEQLHRMECLSQEPVLFEDVLCQMHDMVQPEAEGVFTLRDLKRQRSLAGILFNILFNLNKFIAFETRDPFVVRQVLISRRSPIGSAKAA